MATETTLGRRQSVSAILPTYNSAAFVHRAIDSVLRQEGEHLAELIIVDDCSSDGSADLIEERYGSDSRVKLLRLEVNKGPGAARNHALAVADGAWVAPIDADDAWTPDRLTRLISQAGADIDMLFDNLIAYDQAVEVTTGPIFPSLPIEMTFESMVADKVPQSKFNYGYLKPVVRRSFIEQTRVSYPEIRISEDLIFYLELLSHRPKTQVTSEAGYIYTTPVGAISRRRSNVSATYSDDLLVADTLQILADKLRNRLAPNEVEALVLRAEGLRRSAPLSRLYDSWTRGQYLSVVHQCLTEPGAQRALLRKLGERKPWRLRSPG